MAKFACLYTYDVDQKDFKRFEKIELSERALNLAKKEPDIETIPIWVNDSPYNKILEDILNIRSIWVSPNEGEAISTGKCIIIWFAEPNDILAIKKITEYQTLIVDKYVIAIKKRLAELYKILGDLYSRNEIPRPEIHSTVQIEE